MYDDNYEISVSYLWKKCFYEQSIVLKDLQEENEDLNFLKEVISIEAYEQTS